MNTIQVQDTYALVPLDITAPISLGQEITVGSGSRPTVPAAIRALVLAGDFATEPGLLRGNQPAGSLSDMRFSEAGWLYWFLERGSAQIPIWHRIPLA